MSFPPSTDQFPSAVPADLGQIDDNFYKWLAMISKAIPKHKEMKWTNELCQVAYQFRIVGYEDTGSLLRKGRP
jgi:hypothetical protein